MRYIPQYLWMKNIMLEVCAKLIMSGYVSGFIYTFYLCTFLHIYMSINK